MPLGALSRGAVLQAVQEFDELGREVFLRKYGFGRATQYALRIEGRDYDPKAIAGVAHGIDHPEDGPLPNTAFSGGLQLLPAYRETGFTVVRREEPATEISLLLQQIFGSYTEARQRSWSGQDPVNLLFRDLEKSLADLEPISRRPTVTVKASTGLGNWAGVPWVALLDSRETDSTQSGVYPVLLFREDMTGAYLTVAQGVTQPGALGHSALQTHLQATADAVVRSLTGDVAGAGFAVGADIDLRSRGQLARRYQSSTIIHKLYEASDLPDDAAVESDLETALSAMDDYLDGHERETPGVVRSLESAAQSFRDAVDASGLLVPHGTGDRVVTLLAALITKPFVILTGLSGSGKTQLALRLGDWLGDSREGPRFLSVAVRPDWTGPEAIFGYEDALKLPTEGRAAWYVPEALRFILRAAREPDVPYLLLLDEMNLAHVERYFSDFLSGIESRAPVVPNLELGEDGEWRVGAADLRLPLPRNLLVIGTVNVDETTYQFSPKVLDRAFTFEVRTSTEELDPRMRRPVSATVADPTVLRALCEAVIDDTWQERDAVDTAALVASRMQRLHLLLTATGDEFGHRVFYEALRLAVALERLGHQGADLALDQIVLLKILPRVHGSRRRVEPLLRTLAAFAYDPDGDSEGQGSLAEDARLLLSARKVQRMLHVLEADQFVSFTS